MAVQAAADIARSWGSTLHVVTATRAPTARMGSASGAAMVDSGVGHVLADEAAQKVAERAVESFGSDLQVQTHAAQGNADDVILSTAVEVGADLIVVGSKGMQRRPALPGQRPELGRPRRALRRPDRQDRLSSAPPMPEQPAWPNLFDERIARDYDADSSRDVRPAGRRADRRLPRGPRR